MAQLIVHYVPICSQYLGTELIDLSILMASNDKLSQGPPHGTGDLVLIAGYRQVGLVVICRHTHRESLVIPLRGAVLLLINIFSKSVTVRS